MRNIRKHTSDTARGFTLIELIVAVGLFTIVMLISVGALLALAGANRKAQALQSVLNNLNVAIDGMVRAIRMGTDYHCGDWTLYTVPTSCSGGGTTFAFERFGGSGDIPTDQSIYWFESGKIYKSETGSKTTAYAITAPDVVVDSVSFYVVGTARGDGDTVQPKVLITIRGTALANNVQARTSFVIQATAVQRLLDL